MPSVPRGASDLVGLAEICARSRNFKDHPWRQPRWSAVTVGVMSTSQVVPVLVAALIVTVSALVSVLVGILASADGASVPGAVLTCGGAAATAAALMLAAVGCWRVR